MRRCKDLISCLALFQPTITKWRRICSQIQQNQYEIEVDNNQMVYIYLRYMEKFEIWQLVFNIGMMDINVGYGFGENKESARQSAFAKLSLINQK